MKVFISWSGDISQRVGATLRKHLPLMIQSLDVFMSKHDLESGVRWARELSAELDASSFGILCLTEENLVSPWLQFEAGALSKHADGRACGLLIGGLSPATVVGPLSQFQHRPFGKSGFFQLVKDINNSTEHPLVSEALDAVVSKWWGDIAGEYEAAVSSARRVPSASPRRERDLLEEILLRMRTLEAAAARGPEPLRAVLGDILTRPVNYDSLGWYTLWKFPDRPVSDQLQNQLLRDLDLTRYRTIADIDAVVDRARAAVEAYAAENSAWFRYGTDFLTKSLGFVDLDFRARHAFATRTLAAFERYGEMVNVEVVSGA